MLICPNCRTCTALLIDEGSGACQGHLGSSKSILALLLPKIAVTQYQIKLRTRKKAIIPMHPRAHISRVVNETFVTVSDIAFLLTNSESQTKQNDEEND